MLATLSGGGLTLGYSLGSRGVVSFHTERAAPLTMISDGASELFHARGQIDLPFMLQANLVQAPAAAATEPLAATAAATSGMPIDQQLQDLQQAIQLAKLKLQLAETQYSSLESLSKQLVVAQKDAAETLSKTQTDIAADIAAARASIESSVSSPGSINAALNEDVAASVAYAPADVVQAASAALASSSSAPPLASEAVAATTVDAADAAADAAGAAADAAGAAADALQSLGTDAVAQTAQAAVDVAGFDATPIVLVGALLPFLFVQFAELMSVPRVTGDGASSGGGPLPGFASLAAYADSKNRSPADAGRSAPQIVFHGLLNLEREGLDKKGWLYGGQKDWQKGYTFRQAAAPSALYSNLPAPSSADATATAVGPATGVLAPADIAMPSWVSESSRAVVAKELADAAGATSGTGTGKKGKKARRDAKAAATRGKGVVVPSTTVSTKRSASATPRASN